MTDSRRDWPKTIGNKLILTSLGVTFCIAAAIFEDNDFFTRRLPQNAKEELSKAPCLDNFSTCEKKIRLSDQYTTRALLRRDDHKMPPLYARETRLYDNVDSAIKRDNCYEAVVIIGHEKKDNVTEEKDSVVKVTRYPSPCKV